LNFSQGKRGTGRMQAVRKGRSQNDGQTVGSTAAKNAQLREEDRGGKMNVRQTGKLRGRGTSPSRRRKQLRQQPLSGVKQSIKKKRLGHS